MLKPKTIANQTSFVSKIGNSSIRTSRIESSAKTFAATTASETLSITEVFEGLTKKKQCAFVPFLVAGDPDLGTTELALKMLDSIGADVIELGVPYSDPLADGPVIHASATRALAGGATLVKVLEMVKRVAPTLKAPLVLFTYINPIMRRGYEKFMGELQEAGVKGLLVPDIPLEETYTLSALAKERGVDLVLLTTPTTTSDRMKSIAEKTEGFLYLVSVTGVTGMRTTVATKVEGLVEELKNYTDKPICVGFGVSKGEHAQSLEGWGADGAIAGSALVRALGEAATPEEGLAAVEALARELRDALPPRV